VRWRVAGRIAIAWLITLPASGLMAAVAELIARIGPIGIAIDAVIGVGVIVLIYALSRRNRVAHHNVTDSGQVPVIQSPAESETAAVKRKKAVTK
jgi:PiT family inorganic phosphate transporter